MEDVFLPIVIVGMLFIGMPWVVLHYVTKWKQAKTLTGEDENLLDELHHMARTLEERLHTIERIIAADNPDFRPESHLRGPDRPVERDLPDYDISRRN